MDLTIDLLVPNQEFKNPKSFRWCHIGDQNHFPFEPLIEPNLNPSAFQVYSVDHYHQRLHSAVCQAGDLPQTQQSGIGSHKRQAKHLRRGARKRSAGS